MTQDFETKPANGAKQRAVRRPRKSFPLMSLKDTLILPKGILEFGVKGEISRLTLMDKIGWTPNSSKTRVLISSSFRYGLTTGNYSSPTLHVTDNGQVILNSSSLARKDRETQFHLAMNQFGPFKSVYEKLKGQRLPDEVVLKDELGLAEVEASDRDTAAKVFVANLRFLDLVQEVAGQEQVIAIEEVLEEDSNIDDTPLESQVSVSPVDTVMPVEKNGNTAVATNRPALHIDIQVHIDPTSSADQIDEIFASMARHLYGLE